MTLGHFGIYSRRVAVVDKLSSAVTQTCTTICHANTVSNREEVKYHTQPVDYSTSLRECRALREVRHDEISTHRQGESLYRVQYKSSG